jgi:hypothetical protein
MSTASNNFYQNKVNKPQRKKLSLPDLITFLASTKDAWTKNMDMYLSATHSTEKFDAYVATLNTPETALGAAQGVAAVVINHLHMHIQGPLLELICREVLEDETNKLDIRLHEAADLWNELAVMLQFDSSLGCGYKCDELTKALDKCFGHCESVMKAEAGHALQ